MSPLNAMSDEGHEKAHKLMPNNEVPIDKDVLLGAGFCQSTIGIGRVIRLVSMRNRSRTETIYV